MFSQRCDNYSHAQCETNKDRYQCCGVLPPEVIEKIAKSVAALNSQSVVSSYFVLFRLLNKTKTLIIPANAYNSRKHCLCEKD